MHGDSPYILRIGQISAELLSEHKRNRVNCSAFLTACSPYGRQVDEAENRQRQRDLANELTRRGLTFVAGVGQHPSNEWPGEESFLVFGLNQQAAKALGQRLEQNAIIWPGRRHATVDPAEATVFMAGLTI